jgi:tetratricopeptide (TPR) repeat protein
VSTAIELHTRGVAALSARRLGLAARLLNRAADAAGDDVDLRARVVTSQAFLAYETGDVAGAFERCHDVLGAEGISPGTKGIIHCQLAMLLLRRGETRDALTAFATGIPLIEDRIELGKAHINRGGVHLAQGNLIEASVDFEQALRQWTAAGADDLAAMAQHNLGYACFRRGDLVGALGHFEESRERLAAMSPIMAATVNQDRAEVLLAAGQQAEGRAALQAAAAAFGRRRMAQRRGEAELAIARTLLDSDPSTARSLARAAARRFDAVGAPAWKSRAELTALVATTNLGTATAQAVGQADHLADVLAEQGLRWEAMTARLAAVRLALGRQDAVDAAARIRRIGRARHAPLYVRLLVRQVGAECAVAHGRRSAALHHVSAGLAELNSWQSSFGSLDLQTSVAGHGRRLGVRGLELAMESRKPATLFEWSERARMLASRVQPVRAPQNPEIVEGLAELRGDVTAAREAELRTRIRELAWRHDGSRAVMDPVSLPELQAGLDDDTALVAYVVAAGQVVALVVTRDDAAWRDLGPDGPLRELLGGLLPDLDMAASDLPDPIGPVVRGGLVGRLEKLADLLVGPLVDDLGDRGVVLTPSGVLAGVPWTLLPGLAGRPVTVAQSATSWLARRATPLRTASAGFVAGPRVARAEDEVTAAAKEWPSAAVLTNSAATAGAVSALAAGVDVLHIAAHGQHSAENPLFSGLQLADGLWFGYDIDQLEAVPDVVLLSACEVGRSTVRWGEELIGMATAWLHAGTRCVIASPAAVADQAAYDALLAVHRGLASGLTPAAALAAAVPTATADRPPVPFLCFG